MALRGHLPHAYGVGYFTFRAWGSIPFSGYDSKLNRRGFGVDLAPRIAYTGPMTKFGVAVLFVLFWVTAWNMHHIMQFIANVGVWIFNG